MNMLSKLLPSHKNKQTALAAEDFLLKIQPKYTNLNNQVTYEEPAIPMGQADVFPDPIELKQGDVFDAPIKMQAQNDQ